MLILLYILLPFLYLLLISTTEREEDGVVEFNLTGGFLILILYMFTLIFVESNDKPTYLGYYLDAENFYGNYEREFFWGKLQLFLSAALFKNELLYWLFYSIIYCMGYYAVANKFFPYPYAGYFVLCVVGCMGFVSYGSNTIRAGFGIALLLMAFSTNRLWLKILLSVASVGTHLSMLIPVMGYLVARYVVRKTLWCELAWLLFFVISAATSVVSDILTLVGDFDTRASEFDLYETIGSYHVGFRVDFILYSLIPVLFVKYNFRNMLEPSPMYEQIYRMYVLVNALWLLFIRVPYSDRFAYLSWFLIPFLLLYPVLNGRLDTQHPQRYILRVIGLFVCVGTVLAIKQYAA